MSAELFEKASRKQFRFESPNGLLTVEELWDIPLTTNKPNRANLDDIAKDLSKQVKATGEEVESFVLKASKKDNSLTDKFELVKYIIKVRVAEDEATMLRKANRDRKQQLLTIIAQKELEGLLGTDLEQLRAMVASMED